MHLVRTDLPAPLSPHSAVTCPAGRSRSTPDSAWTAPKCLLIPRNLSNGSAPPAAFAIVRPPGAGAAPVGSSIRVNDIPLTPICARAAALGSFLLRSAIAGPRGPLSCWCDAGLASLRGVAYAGLDYAVSHPRYAGAI